MKTNKNIILIAILLLTSLIGNTQNQYFFPNTGSFDPKIPTPEQFLGYPIGSHYTRHDEIVAYFNELARLSTKIKVQVIGKTYENRPQIIATITSPENSNRIDDIRKEHLTLTDPSKPIISSKEPVVVLLGYSVHGNETSSGEATLLTAYYLVANQSEETAGFLKEAVIFIDPALNPDGRDRAASWHNSLKSFPPVADPADLEHNGAGGGSNHYGTNLNRDWLSASQIETRNRLAFFHQWYPNVQIDFHEMGTNSTYYFEPSPANHESPIIPKESYAFNTTLAKYFAQTLDKIGSLYYSRENFDNLSPIYGSTYPDFFGAVGATFEQGSSRGLVQESENGLLTFPFSIRNHTSTGIAAVRGAVAEKENLFKLQKNFFQSALDLARANPEKAFIFGDSRDVSLTQDLLSLVLAHHLNVYNIPNDITIDGKKYEKGKAFIVPSVQPFFRIVHSVFEETPTLKDSAFYDNTSWSIVHAYGLQYSKINSPSFSLGEQVNTLSDVEGSVAGKSNYAYLLSWNDYNASTALFYLLDKGVFVKNAHLPFSAVTPEGKVNYGLGSLVIPVNSQSISSDSLYQLIGEAAKIAKVKFNTTETGYNIQGGIDLGSNNIHSVKKPQVAIFTGANVNSEAGQVWFLLNDHLHLPVSKVDVSNLSRTSIDRYNTIILVGSSYATLDKEDVLKLKNWVTEGGTLITFRNASDWALKELLAKEKPAEGVTERTNSGRRSENTRTEGLEPTKRLDYGSREVTETAKRVNGGIFLTDIDITNPIAFGLPSRKIYFTKTGSTILQLSKDQYSTVAKYYSTPFVSGYVSKQNTTQISNTAAIVIQKAGRGNVILFAEDPTYRNYWHGTDRLLINSIFFGNQLAGGGRERGSEEE